MPTLLIYLFKVNTALILFCAGYYFVFRKLTFYTLNRVYLITALLFSSIYPLVDFSAILPQHDVVKPLQITDVQFIYNVSSYGRAEDSGGIESYWKYLLIVFWAGVTIMAIRLVLQLVSLFTVHHRSIPQKIYNRQVRIIKDDASAFSFWRSIYINPAKYSETEIKSVIAHEHVHVKQWHTLDILLAEVSLVFHWFNPGIWLIKKAITENLEFITDREILKEGIDAKNYQYSLLYASFNTSPNAVVNHFNLSTIKKRIMMMNAKKSSAFSLSSYSLMIPVVTALLLVFGTSKAELIKKGLHQADKITHKAMITAQNFVLTGIGKDDIKTHANTILGEKKRVENKLNMISGAMPIVQKKINIADTPKIRVIPQKAIMFSPGSESTYCLLNGKQITTQQANNIETDKIESITVLKGSSAVKLFGDVASQGAVLIVTKGEENSAAVLNIMQKVASVRSAEKTDTTNSSSPTLSMASPKLYPNINANTFSITTAVPDSTKKLHNNSRPVQAVGARIKNQAVTVRGFASPQKNITVAPNGSVREIIVQGYATDSTKAHSVSTKFVIDDKDATKEDFDLLDPQKIESINVMKDRRTKESILVITTKKSSKPAF